MKFTSAYWTVNIAEMLERTAYYGIFIAITFYLSNLLGFTDIEAGIISGLFSATTYFLQMFSGAYADRLGYRKSLLLAFGLMPIAYFSLGLLPYLYRDFGEGYRWLIVPVMLILVFTGSITKSIIRASVARETTTENRAKGYSIFYMIVNIGAFSGKSIIDPLRGITGQDAYIYVNFISAALCLIAFITTYFLYKSVNTAGEGKSFREIGQGMLKLFTKPRLLVLILIAAGFWTIQQQLYASMPKYVVRMVGESAKPGWIANVNPLVVVLLVNVVTSFMKNRSALTSIFIGILLVPVAALIMSTGTFLGDQPILGLHPVTLMLVIGIMLQGLCECFITPRYLEYFSYHAPKGEEGLYLGFSQMDSFFASLIGFFMSGFLLDRYCPDPAKFATHEEWLAASAHAHYIWYYFAAVGLVAALTLVTFSLVTKRIDAKKATAEKQ